MKENWKSIKGYAGLYEVSDLGNVRSLNYSRTEQVRVLNPILAGEYYSIHLYKNGKSKMFRIHRLVITTFRGPIPKGMQVNHLNENKLDNRLSNLEVVTAKENINWGTRNERAAKAIAKANSKKLDLTLAKDPYTKLSFQNSYEASNFFKYKAKRQVAVLISAARQRGENFINIRREKYYFSQEA